MKNYAIQNKHTGRIVKEFHNPGNAVAFCNEMNKAYREEVDGREGSPYCVTVTRYRNR